MQNGAGGTSMRRPTVPRTASGWHRPGRRTRALLGGVAVLGLLVTTFGGGVTANAGTGAGSTTMTLATSAPWTNWSFNPFATNFPGAAQLAYLPLAIQKWPNLTSFTPQLATSWSVQGSNFVVKLQPKARWQDGSAFTSTDVVDTVYLDGLTGGAIWNDITKVSASGPKEVVLTARPGVSMVLLENNLFNSVTPYPSHVWGKHVTNTLKSDVVQYFNQEQTDPTGAANSAASKAIGSMFQSLTKVDPSSLDGDGPYKLTGITTQEARLVKWDGFYDASKITVDNIVYTGLQQPDVNSYLLSGRADFSSGWLYMPPNIVQQWRHTANAHLVDVPGTFQAQIVFNDSQFPFNQTQVRQALAYAFPLQKMNTIAWGTDAPHAIAPAVPDGLTSQVAQQFLTKDQLNSLNKYSYSPTQAANLLTAAGFKKQGQWWYAPDGKQFTLTLNIDAAWTDQVAAFRVAAPLLTQMGIQTTLSTVEDLTYQSDLHTGNFQVAAYCCAGGSPDPLTNFAASPMGSVENYTSLGSHAGQKGISFGPMVDVPGLGTVNVPSTLDSQADTIGPGDKMKSLTWDWVQFVNQQVPYLQYTNFSNQIAYSNARFDWPKGSDPLWTQVNNGSWAIIVGQENGSIHPK